DQVKSNSDLGLPRRRHSLHILQQPKLINHPRTTGSSWKISQYSQGINNTQNPSARGAGRRTNPDA
ncbi:hypothetical protein, partial [Pseudarthrobacter chlorophenolicus]|uniref:hypothetical protein n=1 Tax=Pseudarthrobacter chlorophenolicus TaxID=85085 RepID=UPI001F1B1810